MRIFSERLKLPGNIIQFYKDPVLAEPAPDPLPEPLVTLKIPPGQKLVYIVLSSELHENRQPFWRGRQLNAGDWKVPIKRHGV